MVPAGAVTVSLCTVLDNSHFIQTLFITLIDFPAIAVKAQHVICFLLPPFRSPCAPPPGKGNQSELPEKKEMDKNNRPGGMNNNSQKKVKEMSKNSGRLTENGIIDLEMIRKRIFLDCRENSGERAGGGWAELFF